MLNPMRLRSRRLALMLALLAPPLAAQKPSSQWADRLVGHPLYLRAAWTEDKIDFDAGGKPAAEAHRGSVTLSGIDITEVRLSGHTLLLKGQRVALVSRAAGDPLKRVPAISSTTRMPFTLRQKDYKANEPIQFTILADAHGSFDAALDAIFADGLAQLVVSVPAFWRCYAASWFVDGPVAESAAHDVLECAQTQSKGVSPVGGYEPDGFSPVAVVQSVPPQVTHAAAELRLSGVSTVYATVSPGGKPYEFQVLSAVGGGLDEVALQALSQSTFRPASINGRPMAAGFEYSLSVEPK